MEATVRIARPCIQPDCDGYARVASRCPLHAAEHKRARNSNAARARQVVVSAPWCHCTADHAWHGALCGSTEDLTSGHVIPLARGGRPDGPQITECRRCNSAKGAR